jgi:hypothetical protein
MSNRRILHCLLAVLVLTIQGGMAAENPIVPNISSFSQSAPPQTGRSGELLGGPRLGFVFDRASQKFREVTGIPGAALLGVQIQPELPLDVAWLSPSQNLALGQGVQGELFQVDLNAAVAPCRVLAHSGNPISRVYWSTSGSVAVLVPEQSTHIFLFKASTSTIVEIPLGSWAGEVSALAVSDDGESVLAGIRQQEGSLLLLGSSRGDFSKLGSLSNIAALVFLPGTQYAFVALPDENQILSVQGLPASPRLAPLSVKKLELAAPSRLAVSDNGARLLVLNAAAQYLNVIDFKQNQAFMVDCGAPYGELIPWPGGELFQLQPYSGAPLALLQVTQRGSQVTLVPGDPNLTREQGVQSRNNAVTRRNQEGRIR